jgi:hypothetical protein
MLPIRTSSIFRSRWTALLWAAGIIWTAVQFAGSPSPDQQSGNAAVTDASGAEVDAEQMKQAEKLLDQFGR